MTEPTSDWERENNSDWFSRLMTASVVPGGATNPSQFDTSMTSMPSSRNVGTLGKTGDGWSLIRPRFYQLAPK